ncbi:MAG TPA: DNA mismatch repair protein MutS [Stellaceae bacterium]|nr:DNA mismatch repair protein MutS [Stellaceae bacterium]
MKARLLHPVDDFDWQWALGAAAERRAARGGRHSSRIEGFDPRKGLPWNADALVADLSLNALLDAMAPDDDYVFEVARKILLTGVHGDLATIRYRQEILRDCLSCPAAVREIYRVAVDAMEKQGWGYLGFASVRYPDSMLRGAIETMANFLGHLKKLRQIADAHAPQFASEGWIAFFRMLKRDLDDAYFSQVEDHLEALKFRGGEFFSAQLGTANKGGNYILHRPPARRWSLRAWWASLFADKPPVYRFQLHPRDEAGAQALIAERNRAIGIAANALGQSADHVRDFFGMLRAELAFYVGCLNLGDQLAQRGAPICLPLLAADDSRRLSCRGLCDVALALSLGRRVVGNSANADGKDLIIITGSNNGGKSTFLRGLGLAQLMMQSGMFVAAEAFCGCLCNGVFTHYKREEDARMESGKLDEELGRMSEIVDHLAPHSLMLFNESFAATNEREGSEIARQAISALVERQVRVLCVTHLYELAHGFYDEGLENALFLRAERLVDGTRTFRLIEGEPLATSFGEDLYRRIFDEQEDGDEIENEKGHAVAR